MFQIKRRGPVGYDDLLREMETIEQSLLRENSALAMDMMVLDTKIRERFRFMEQHAQAAAAPKQGWLGQPDLPTEEELTMDDLRALIPQDLPPFPTYDVVDDTRRRKQKFETVGMAAVLAMITAIGVFGLASLLQLALSWLL